jgi:dUTP pyrophosphatase
LSYKTTLRVANSPGTVDSGFRDEVKILLSNIGKTTQVVNVGDRIAQAVICPVIQAELLISDELSDSVRGVKGFGSSGIKS